MSMTPTQRVEILRASCCVAGADGVTTPDELEHILRLAKAVGVGEASLDAMMRRAERDPEFYKQQFKVLRAEPLKCLDTLLQVAIANGALQESEFEVLKGLANQLQISEAQFRERVSTAVKGLNQ